MKALIWIGCIFGASFVETLLHSAGIGGALPTIAVYGVGFALARHFCKKHEEKQREVPVKSDMSEPLGTQNFGAKQEERTIAEVSATCDCSEAELEDTPTAEGVIAKSAVHLDGEATELENTSDVELSREALPEITETESPSREIQEEALNMESAGQKTEQTGDQAVQQADQDGKPSGAKKRYCKRCGALVDQKTKNALPVGSSICMLQNTCGLLFFL